jgi:hypothetical protein
VVPGAAMTRCAEADGAPLDVSTPFEDTFTITPDDEDGVFEGSCAKTPGFAERVFAVNVPSVTGMDLAVHTNFNDLVLDSYVYIRRTCTDATTQLACNDDIVPGFDPGFNYASLASVNNVQPGTYYVYVDTSQENGWRQSPCVGAECAPSINCECVPQTTHVRIYLRPVVGEGMGCDPIGIDNRCETGTTCTGDAGSATGVR